MPERLIEDPLAQENKRVGVTLTAQEYRVLKLYAARYDMTMGEVIKEFTMAGVQKHTGVCQAVDMILQSESVAKDARLDKDCWGSLCLCCVHRIKCAEGGYPGLFEFNETRFGSWESVGKGELPVFE